MQILQSYFKIAESKAKQNYGDTEPSNIYLSNRS